MKLRSKAGVPIITIAIIIIVLVAGIGMWWFFTQRADCSDVNHTGVSYWIEGQHPWYEHEDRYAQISETGDDYKLLYVSGGAMKGLTCNNGVKGLDACIDQLHNAGLITDDEYKDFNHIADCIKAGCPGCV